jgi:hypothetical protein
MRSAASVRCNSDGEAMKSRKKSVRAWAVLGPDGKINFGYGTYEIMPKASALEMVKTFSQDKAVPCTITYTLPRKKP